MNLPFRIVLLLAFVSIKFTALSQNLTIYRCTQPVETVTEKVIGIIKSSDLIYFETVDHDEIARERGTELPKTKSILFEQADLTTQLITCQQTTALDLPLEILVWEENGDVYIGFIDPKFMKKRFLVLGCDEVLEELSKIMIRVCTDALRE